MQSFLNKIAKKAIENFPNRLDELSIVLPSRRSIVFIKEEFKKELSETAWLPKFYSLEDFVFELDSTLKLDQIDLVFELYEVHKEIMQSKAEPLDEFLNWAPTLLYDFNEIDRYLIDPSEIFGFLTEAKAIEVWNLNNEELTDFQRQYVRFWRQLEVYYQQLNARLKKSGKVYQGLAFRMIAEKILSHQLKEVPENQIYFCGFNALTEAERIIIDYFQSEKNAQLFWDADAYYLNNESHEAGLFLRQHKERSKSGFNWLESNWAETEKEINIFGISGNVAQAKLVANLIDSYTQTSGIENTAVVLSDENLLLPILESLPPKVETANVTMGYPLSASAFYSWFEAYLNLLKGADYEKDAQGQSTAKPLRFYYKDLSSFLENKVIAYYPQESKESIQQLLHQINENQQPFVAVRELAVLNQIFGIQLIPEKEINHQEVLELFLALIDELKNSAQLKKNSLELEFLFHFYKLFNRLQLVQDSFLSRLNVDAFLQLFRQLVKVDSLSFIGEPLGGLQIMGVLESRTLDFKKVIITSVNEGVLPSGKTQNSFIPFDIKHKFGLPSYREKDAIFAYHFYRLLQRAEQVSIVYNTKTESLKGGERSRFIEQMVYELPKMNSKISIHEETVAPRLTSISKEPIEIKKNPELLAKIRKHLESGLSVSAINSFLSCPLDYYYKYILRLKEDDSSIDAVESNVFGTIVHDTLEVIYAPFVGQLLDKKSLLALKNSAEEELLRQFVKLTKIEPKSGTHKLNFEVAKVFVNAMIDLDVKTVKAGGELHLIGLEESFSVDFPITLGAEVLHLKLRGKIDRVDRLNDTKRIIDYKTGAVDWNDLKSRDLQTTLNGGKPKFVQLMIYNAAYQKAHGSQMLESGIISLRQISQDFMSLPIDEVEEMTDEFLVDLVARMLSETAVFSHDPKSKYCKFCN